jgi:hypothetical protein
MMRQIRQRGQLLKIHLLPEDRRLLIRYSGLIRQKYGVCSIGLNGLVLTSALQFLDKSCGDNVVLDNIDGRTCLWPSTQPRKDHPVLRVVPPVSA